jgi:hypothetical protein
LDNVFTCALYTQNYAIDFPGFQDITQSKKNNLVHSKHLELRLKLGKLREGGQTEESSSHPISHQHDQTP